MEIINVEALYKQGSVATSVQDDDVIVLYRPSPIRGDGYLPMLFDKSAFSPPGLFSVSKMGGFTFADINVVSSGADTFIELIMPDSILANSVPYGVYFDVKAGFVSASAPNILFSLAVGISPSPSFVSITSGNLTAAQLATPQKVWLPSSIIQQTKSAAADAWARFSFDDGFGNSIPNPQDFISGSVDIYFQYVTFQI